MKFDKQEWNEQSDSAFPGEIRPKMLKDLTSNNKLVGLSCGELIKKIGIPDYKNDSLIIYNIIIDYGGDTDPVYTKKLKFYYSKDSVIYSFKTVEWKSE
jgi:hypothetical protein